MTDLNILLLLQAFVAAGVSAQSLSLDGDVAADDLEAWAADRGFPVERERLTRSDFYGTEIGWVLVRVTVRDHTYVTASRSDERPSAIRAALEKATKTITGFDYSDASARLDAEMSAFPADEHGVHDHHQGDR